MKEHSTVGSDARALGELGPLLRSYERHLRALNRSPQTIRTYGAALQGFRAYLQAQGMPVVVAHLRREHVESYLAQLLQTRAAKTAATYHTGLATFFAWAVEEGEIPRSPMERLHAPAVPESPVPVLSDPQVLRLLRACEGSSFEARRDLALVRVLLDTGLRRGELLGLTLADLDWTEGTLAVLGKGRHRRSVPFGRKSAQALDRYVRVRDRHPHRDLAALWLSRTGPLHASAFDALLKRRAALAGIAGMHPHLLRHYFAHTFRMAGGQETDLMALAGWSNSAMARRYGASAAASRAREAHKKFGPGDRL